MVRLSRYSSAQGNFMSRPRLLIGSDFSKQSSLALQVGKNWGKKLNAEIHVLHINNSRHSTDALGHIEESEEVSGIVDGLQHSLEEKLIKQESEYGLRPNEVINHVTFGKKNDVLRNEVVNLNAKLLVLGCQGQSGIEDMFLGGTTERAIRSVNCPILAVRDDGCLQPQKIFWAVDLSPRSDFVFEWLKILAGIFNPELDLVMVSDDPNLTAEDYPQLRYFRDHLKAAGHQPTVTLIPSVRGSVEKALEKRIQEREYDLVVMGTEAKKGLRRFFLGSVAEYLTHHVRKSFLVVKHPED
jgi:nucleotide-binding universal stress UspA family protein